MTDVRAVLERLVKAYDDHPDMVPVPIAVQEAFNDARAALTAPPSGPHGGIETVFPTGWVAGGTNTPSPSGPVGCDAHDACDQGPCKQPPSGPDWRACKAGTCHHAVVPIECITAAHAVGVAAWRPAAEMYRAALYEIACGNNVWTRSEMIDYAAETLRAAPPSDRHPCACGKDTYAAPHTACYECRNAGKRDEPTATRGEGEA